jgi:DNA recombination protein RmuC
VLVALLALSVGLAIGFGLARLRVGTGARRDSEMARSQFEAVAAAALRHNNESFVALAKETLAPFHQQAAHELEKREKAVETLVKPINEALERTREQIRAMELERAKAYGSLTGYLRSMQEAEAALGKETRNLATALRKPDVRGRYGELTLQRVVELAGMTEYCDFVQQEQLATDSGAFRPDLVVRMPGARAIVVDAKAPLDAYLDALEAKDEAGRCDALDRHAKALRDRLHDLSSKAYWSQFTDTPDFVVLFIPGDQFLIAALERDPDLQEDALRNHVVLATTNSFMALLKVVAYGWREQQVAANAERIRKLGEQLYKRLSTFAGHLADVGKALGDAVHSHNKAVGSFDSRLLPSARRFAELGVGAKEEVPDVEAVDQLPRKPGGDPAPGPAA